METKKRRTKKIEAEKQAEPKVVAEDNAINFKKKFTINEYIVATEDLSLKVNNAYFRTPYNRCPNCNKGNNVVLAKFGFNGHANMIGNLKGFQATIGDIIAWNSNTYKGLSIIKSKNNGVYELETSPFDKSLDEPAVIERLLVPMKYREIIEEMAMYLANSEQYDGKLIKIGNGEYPDVIEKKL